MTENPQLYHYCKLQSDDIVAVMVGQGDNEGTSRYHMYTRHEIRYDDRTTPCPQNRRTQLFQNECSEEKLWVGVMVT